MTERPKAGAGRPDEQASSLLVLLAVISLVALALSGCKPASSTPVASIQAVLDARLGRSADPASYAPYFQQSSVATALADDSKGATSAPIPRWEPPYVSKQATSSAEVVVKWLPDAAHKGWPKADVFVLEMQDGRWKIIDAQAVQGSIPKPVAGR